MNYEDDKKVLGCKVSSSVSNVLSSLAEVVKSYVIGRFPTGYFQSEFVSTALLSQKADTATWNKVKYPAIAINPEMMIGDSLGDPWPSFHNSYLLHYKNRKDYFPVLYNEDDRISISYIPQRLRFAFSFKIRVRGRLEGMNLLNYISRTFEEDGYFYLNNQVLAIEIPKLFIKAIKMELFPNEEDNDAFLNYLKTYSPGYIERVLDLSDGNDAYTFNHECNLLFNVDGKPSVSYSNKGKDEGYSDIEFNMNVDFWNPSDFLLEIGEPKKVEENELIGSDNFLSFDTSSAFYNYVVTVDQLPHTYEDKMLTFYQKFITEEKELETDVLPLENYMDNFTKEMIDFLVFHQKDPSEYFEFKIYYGSHKINPVRYSFNFKTKELSITQPFSDSVYTVAIYSNLARLNELKKVLDISREKKIPIEDLITRI